MLTTGGIICGAGAPVRGMMGGVGRAGRVVLGGKSLGAILPLALMGGVVVGVVVVLLMCAVFVVVPVMAVVMRGAD